MSLEHHCGHSKYWLSSSLELYKVCLPYVLYFHLCIVLYISNKWCKPSFKKLKMSIGGINVNHLARIDPCITHTQLTGWHLKTSYKCQLPARKSTQILKSLIRCYISRLHTDCTHSTATKTCAHMLHVTSVPYPSEYLVTIALFFPQRSHRRVSWEHRAGREPDWIHAIKKKQHKNKHVIC